MITYQLPLETILTGIRVEGPAFAEDSGKQNQTARIGIGKRLEKECVDDCINGCIGADAEAQRGENCDRKGSGLAKLASGIAEISTNYFNPVKRTEIAHLVFS